MTQSWQRGALPVITWQSAPHDYPNAQQNISSYAMKQVARGTFDHYLASFATGIVDTRLPVVIRLDQEMNGNWYPWSAGYQLPGDRQHPCLLPSGVAAHLGDLRGRGRQPLHDLGLDAVPGPTPLSVDSTTGFTRGDTGLLEDYPGDPYVDWIGMSGYQFRPSQPSTYDFIFGGTLNGNAVDIGLKRVSARKPIFIAEMGSAQTVGSGQDNTAVKAAWTATTLAAVAADPRIVGFVLFNNNVKGLHTIKLDDGAHLTVDTDWEFDSSPSALAAFRKGITNSRFGAGLMQAQLKGLVTLKLPSSAASATSS